MVRGAVGALRRDKFLVQLPSMYSDFCSVLYPREGTSLLLLRGARDGEFFTLAWRMG